MPDFDVRCGERVKDQLQIPWWWLVDMGQRYEKADSIDARRDLRTRARGG